VSQELWESEKIIQLSKIPSVIVLKSQLVNMISYPLVSLENVLNQITLRFLLTLKEIEKTK
jgi:ribosomal protein L10